MKKLNNIKLYIGRKGSLYLTGLIVAVILFPFPDFISNANESISEEKYLIKIKEPEEKEEFVAEIKGNRKILDISAIRSIEEKDSNWVELHLTKKDLAKVEKDNDVLMVTKPKKRTITAEPNDPEFVEQWGLPRIGLGAKTSPTISSGWDITTGDAATVIAVIDTGVNTYHSDLQGNLLLGTGQAYNFGDNNVNIDDVDGHGTHVAGTVAAVSNNSTGVAGVCWKCKILPLKVMNSSGTIYDSYVANAIHYAVDKGAKVINLSLGGTAYSYYEQDAINYAWENDVIVIAAAGNNSASASDSYPGGTTNSISVGASYVSNGNDITVGFSNTGKRLDLIAPGANILSTTHDGIYGYASGTSMAAPHVAGLAGLIRSQNPTWNAKQVRYALLKNIDDVASYGNGFDDQSGFGRVNALKALQSANTLPNDTSSPNASLTTPSSNIGGNFNITGTASDANLYIYTITIRDKNTNLVVKEVSGRSSVTNNTLASVDTTKLTNGEYTFNLRAEDFSGNIKTASMTATVSNRAPNNFATISPSNNAWVTTKRPQFSWHATSDSLSSPISYDVYFNNNLVASNLSSNTYTPPFDLPEGEILWKIGAKNNLGITTFSNGNQSHIVRVDTVAPSDFSISVEVNGSDPKFTFSSSDVTSGINRYEASIDNGNSSNVSSPYQPGSIGDGNHTITIKAIDNAGNSRTSSTNFTINTRQLMLKKKADFDGNGKVELNDLSVLAQNWQKNTSSGDANGDNKVDLSDLSILAQNWQKNF